MTTPENKVKARVKRIAAEYARVYQYMPVQNRFSSPSLDFLFCVNSFFVSIETKTRGKQLTPRQRQTKANMQDAGAFVLRIDEDNLDELRNLFGQLTVKK